MKGALAPGRLTTSAGHAAGPASAGLLKYRGTRDRKYRASGWTTRLRQPRLRLVEGGRNAGSTEERTEADAPSMAEGKAQPEIRRRRTDPQELTIRRTWGLLAASFFVLGLLTALRLVAGQPGAIDFVLASMVVLTGLSAVLHRRASGMLEAGRRSEAESFARILQGLSRSISPDAIVAAIVEELGEATGADHIVVVRLRPDARRLEATLVSRRPGVPSSTTELPISDLEDPAAARGPRSVDVGRSRSRSSQGAPTGGGRLPIDGRRGARGLRTPDRGTTGRAMDGTTSLPRGRQTRQAIDDWIGPGAGTSSPRSEKAMARTARMHRRLHPRAGRRAVSRSRAPGSPSG